MTVSCDVLLIYEHLSVVKVLYGAPRYITFVYRNYCYRGHSFRSSEPGEFDPRVVVYHQRNEVSQRGSGTVYNVQYIMNIFSVPRHLR